MIKDISRGIGKKVLIITNNLDCKSHLHYIAKIENYFIRNGWDIAGGLAGFDKVIICACGYHEAQYQKVIKTIKKLKMMNFAEKEIIIAGCLPKTYEGEIDNIFNGKLVPYGKEELLDEIIAAQVQFKNVGDKNVFRLCEGGFINKEQQPFYIKIEDGCMGTCTYCVIKRAKGKLKSFPLPYILEQYKKASGNGFKKVELIGEDTFAYGLDIETNIMQLIEKLLEIDDSMEILFDQLDIKWLLKYSSGIKALCKKGFFKRLGIGIQHNNEYILRRMGRKIDFNKSYKIIGEIKKETPGIYIVADILIGFPGETKKMFDELVEFLRNDTFIDVIKHAGYSDNPNAPSYKLRDKVDKLEIIKRWNYLKEILKDKCLYNNISESPIENEGTAYQQSFDRVMTICKNTYREIS